MLTIQEIISKEPYKIKVRFNNNDVRTIDFESMISKFPQLNNSETFLKVELDDYPTLSWKGLAKIMDYDGKLIDAPLDFCPDMLYEISVA
jgi:hypothetical protein